MIVLYIKEGEALGNFRNFQEVCETLRFALSISLIIEIRLLRFHLLYSSNIRKTEETVKTAVSFKVLVCNLKYRMTKIKSF